MKTFRILLILLAATALGVAAEGNRYLLILQVSKETKNSLPQARECLGKLLLSGLNGQLHSGDTLGLWTYDRELRAGEFPMQVWSPAAAEGITKGVDDFLKKQSTRNEARIGQMLPALFQVVQDSPAITVLLFSDGFEPVTGTPFDGVINRVFAQHRAGMRQEHVPFVTVLLAREGKIVHTTVNSAAGPVTIPAPPKPAPAVVAASPKPAPAPVVVKSNAPLILDFSKSKPAAVKPPATNKPLPVAPAKTVSPVTASVPAISPSPAVAPAVTVAPPVPVTPVAVEPVKVLPTNPAVVAPATPVVVSPPVASSPEVGEVTAKPMAAAEIPAKDAGVSIWWWLGGLVVAAGVAGLVFRGRRQAGVSAITESIERRKR